MSSQETNGREGPATLELLRAPNVEAFILTDDGVVPNNRRLPLLVYKKALNTNAPDLTAHVPTMLAEQGWVGAWVNGIFDYHHYHSNAHEVLVVCGGQAQVCFGGEHGITLTLAAGDVVVIPAGVAHKSCGAGPDFVVVGAYPRGQENCDLCRGQRDERPRADKNIVSVPRPDRDPLYGAAGPLLAHWQA